MRPGRALVALLLGACTTPEPTPLSFELEFAGCNAVKTGPVCVLPADRMLRLWVGASPEARVTLAAGAPLDAESEPVANGRRYRVRVPEGTTALEVEVTASRAVGRRTLAWVAAAEHPALAAARELRGERPDEALRRLEETLLELPPDARAEALGLLGRLEHDLGRREASYARLRLSMAAAREVGRLSQAVDDGLALAYFLIHDERRLDEAHRLLVDDVAPLTPDYPEGAVRLPYYLALVAAERFDLRAALSQAELAEARATRLGVERIRAYARQNRAVVLGRLGRHREAVAVLEASRADLAPDAPPCERAQLLNNLGWEVVISGRTGASPRDPLPFLQEAVRLYERDCPRPADEANARVSLATALVAAGRVPEASEALLRARRSIDAYARVWAAELEADLALASGRAGEALERHEALLRDSQVTATPEMQWRAQLGVARAQRALGEDQAAASGFAAAATLADELVMRAPVGEGRGTLTADLERGTRQHLRLLLDLHRFDEAQRVARQAGVRLLRYLRRLDRLSALSDGERARWDAALAEYRAGRAALAEEAEADWQAPGPEADARIQVRTAREGALRRTLDARLAGLVGDAPIAAPAPPAPGEALLVYHPLDDGWVGFAVTAAGVTARELGPLDRALPDVELSRRLLAPFAGAFEGVSRLRILPSGWLRQVDLHALPWGDGPLLRRFTVAYGLDLPATAPVSDSGPVLVVADPQDNLSRAREEGRQIAAIWASRGRPVETLFGAPATRDAVQRALATVDRVHFAGHAVYAGHEGWDSALLLARDASLTAGDVLTLPRVPARVVLAGCETARSDDVSLEGIGLAQAFLLAGADEVVAAVRPVPDLLAQRLAVALHEGPASESLPDALRRVQLELHRAGLPGWSAFRALVR